jgi:transcriptional regulator with XRE-family HTH domain
METANYTNVLHMGRKIERVRRLRGMTQTELGDALGISKQAVSKIEQTEQMDNDRIKQIAEALGVTEEGLKKFNEETVLYNTINFYENCGVTTSAVSNNHTFNNFPIEKTIEMFEKLLQKEKDKFERVRRAGKK